MPAAALPTNENDRLKAVNRYRVLDTQAERVFDELTKLTAQICGTPVALLSVLDEKRNWFKSRYGVNADSSPREYAFCAHAILGADVLEVNDASRDPRFADSPLVRFDPTIRFYAGMPLSTPDGHNLGTLCALDVVPRELTDAQRQALRTLAQQAMTLFEMRLQAQLMQERLAEYEEKDSDLTNSNSQVKSLLNASPEVKLLIDLEGRIVNYNTAAQAYVSAYFNRAIAAGDKIVDLLNEQNQEAYHSSVKRTLAGEKVEKELQVIVASEQPSWYRFRYAPMHNALREVIGIILSIKDISSRKEETALDAKKANGPDDAAKIRGQSLRGPLTSVIGIARLLKADEMSDSNREMLGYLKSNAERLDQVMHQVVGTSVGGTASGRVVAP